MSRQPRSQSQIGPILIAAGLVVLMLMAAVILWPRPAGEPGQGQGPYPEIARVSLEEARAAQAAGTAVIVDVRDPASYAASHIAGAVSLPLVELEERLGELDPQAWIITYCT